jgi:hypothetical protein
MLPSAFRRCVFRKYMPASNTITRWLRASIHNSRVPTFSSRITPPDTYSHRSAIYYTRRMPANCETRENLKHLSLLGSAEDAYESGACPARDTASSRPRVSTGARIMLHLALE